MKVIILGAGQVGASVAEGLVSEENDITVVDYDAARLAQLQDRLDLRTVVGDAATPSALRNAGADDADMIIAVTQSDQSNLVACKLAHSVFNVPTRIPGCVRVTFSRTTACFRRKILRSISRSVRNR